MPLRLLKKKRGKHDSQKQLESKEDESPKNITADSTEQEAKSSPTAMKPTFSQTIATCKSRVNHVSQLAESLLLENHSDATQVQERQNKLQEEWTGLMERFEEHEIKYYFKDVEITKTHIKTKLVELSYTHVPNSLPEVEAQQSKLEQVNIPDLQERINCLKAEAVKLSENHGESAEKIKRALSELSSELSQLTQKVTERKLQLNHAHKYQVFMREFKETADDLLNLRTSIAQDDVAELRQKGNQLAELMERDEQLGEILEHAEGLAAGADGFAKTAKDVKKKQKKKNCCVC